MQKGIKKRSGHMPILDTLHLPPGTLEIFFNVFQFGRVSAHIFKIIDYCIKTLLDRLDNYVFSTSVKRGDDVVPSTSVAAVFSILLTRTPAATVTVEPPFSSAF